MPGMSRIFTTVAVGLVVIPTLAAAADMQWTVTSEADYQVQIEFFSKNRDVAWPGGTDAYSINDYLAHTYTLHCQAGEKICYGAWPTGGDQHGHYSTYWGVGLNGTEGCSNCCGICGVDNPDKNLVDEQ
jgi:hypothetical protein